MADASAPVAKTMVYCQVCSYPPEYCEFGSRFKACKKWLQDSEPELFTHLYSDDALSAAASNLSLEAREKLAKEQAKKEAKAEAKAERLEAKKSRTKVTIKRVERNKRKHITSIQGLEHFGIDLKKAAKLFANKFATGASVSKTAAGVDEIVVQGDVSEEVEDVILEKFKEVPEDNIELTEDKPKKKAPKEVAPQPGT
ncbi:Translation machinery-associated protein 22 [Saitoella coloradoensis]